MEKWHKRSNFHEDHFLELFHSIRTDQYTLIGNAYDDDFWIDFTRVFNERIHNDDDGQHKFHPFSDKEIVRASDNLRRKAQRYKHNADLRNKDLLEACYLRCENCSSLHVHPSGLRTGSGASGRSGSRGRTSAGPSGGTHSRPSINDLPVSDTPDGQKARNTLLKLWQAVDEHSHRILRTKYLLKGIEYVNAKRLNSLVFNELESDEERVNFIKKMIRLEAQ